MFSNRTKILWFTLIFNQVFSPSGCHTRVKQGSGLKSWQRRFWQTTRKGANVFNTKVDEVYLQEIKALSIRLIRLTPAKWKPEKRDFLIGDADEYIGIPEQDFQELKKVLDLCEQNGIKVILTMLSLPGCRWRQHNNYTSDTRIYEDARFQKQAGQFYVDLATRLKGHKALVGYNILNEPHPSGDWGSLDQDARAKSQKSLHQVHEMCIKSIRSVDKDITIILDSPSFADPQAFNGLPVFHDQNIIYSFHMYEPFDFTNWKRNQGKFKYPGDIQDKHWDKETIEEYMNVVEVFKRKHNIPSSQILLGEFGGHRRVQGLETYFKHILDYCRRKGYHALFYAIREDEWDGMDYEAGYKWFPQKNPRVETKAWKVLKQWLNEEA